LRQCRLVSTVFVYTVHTRRGLDRIAHSTVERNANIAHTGRQLRTTYVEPSTSVTLWVVYDAATFPRSPRLLKIIIIMIIMIIFVYYSCSHNATTVTTSVTQDSTDTIEHKASIYNET